MKHTEPRQPIPLTINHVVSTRSDRSNMQGAQLNAHRLIAGITNRTHGAEDMASVLAVVPPGAPTKAHMHPSSETILFMVEGWAGTLLGPELQPVFHGPGDFVFIPKQTIHIGFNLSRTHRVVATETRSHKHFNEDVHLTPGLEARALKIIASLQDQFAAGILPLPEGWEKLVGKPYSFED